MSNSMQRNVQRWQEHLTNNNKHLTCKIICFLKHRAVSQEVSSSCVLCMMAFFHPWFKWSTHIFSHETSLTIKHKTFNDAKIGDIQKYKTHKQRLQHYSVVEEFRTQIHFNYHRFSHIYIPTTDNWLIVLNKYFNSFIFLFF